MFELTILRPRAVAASAGLLALLAVIPGCGSGEPGLVPVRGKVTLDGGPWPAEGHLNLIPVGDADPTGLLRPSSVPFDTNGNFVATSYQTGDGLYPGTYQVAVECWEVEPAIAGDGNLIPGKTPVPERYQSPTTSSLTLVVEPKGSTYAEFDVTTP
ncbi:hypothetical protein AB1L88_24245 [Tautonia sp. JC769]|uniref:hypothetical protein n=1 Tax=Tautonia sp. JC769 TaxID=3232135 RepID=UPI0034597E06